VEEDEELASDEEYEEVEEDEEVIESGAVVPALPQAMAKRKEAEEMGDETSVFEGSEQFDYQGRTYMHVPQDLDIDLRKEAGQCEELCAEEDGAYMEGTYKANCGTAVLPWGLDICYFLGVQIQRSRYGMFIIRKSYCGHIRAIRRRCQISHSTHQEHSSYQRPMIG
jgi:hypothetical protein